MSAGSIPAPATANDSFQRPLLRWGPCWYGQAVVTRPDAGSIPATAAPRMRKPKRKSSGRMRGLSRKQVRVTPLWVQVPRLPPYEKRHGARFPVSPLNNTVLWPSGEGSSLTRRRSVVRVHPGSLGRVESRWLRVERTSGGVVTAFALNSRPSTFNSTWHRSPTAEAVVSNTTQCEFESHRC